MKNPVSLKLTRSAVIIALAWLTGCAGMDQYLPVDAPLLTAEQAIKVGSVVENRLLQLLGGPRHDKALLEELNSLINKEAWGSGRFTVSVAEKSTAALYALPGGHDPWSFVGGS